jgi:hypothetical protein
MGVLVTSTLLRRSGGWKSLKLNFFALKCPAGTERPPSCCRFAVDVRFYELFSIA